MINSGKKIRALCDKKNKYSNSCVVGKKNSERSKKHYFFFPPPKSEYFFQQHLESAYFF
jgi:hypothetical protein